MPDSKEKMQNKSKHTIVSLNKRIVELETLVAKLMEKNFPSGQSINKVEKQISEEEFAPKEEKKMKMSEDMKIQSMMNAITILPPNLVDPDTGRHSLRNIGALCGFVVTEEMSDVAYAKLKEK